MILPENDINRLRASIVPYLDNGLWGASLGALPPAYPLPNGKSDLDGLTRTLDALNDSGVQDDGSLPLRSVLERLRTLTTEASLKAVIDQCLSAIDARLPDNEPPIPAPQEAPASRLAVSIEIAASLGCAAMLAWIIVDPDLVSGVAAKVIVVFVLAFLVVATIAMRLATRLSRRLDKGLLISAAAATLIVFVPLLVLVAASDREVYSKISVYHVNENGEPALWVNHSSVKIDATKDVSSYVDGNTVLLIFATRKPTTLELSDSASSATYRRSVSPGEDEQTLDVLKDFQRGTR